MQRIHSVWAATAANFRNIRMQRIHSVWAATAANFRNIRMQRIHSVWAATAANFRNIRMQRIHSVWSATAANFRNIRMQRIHSVWSATAANFRNIRMQRIHSVWAATAANFSKIRIHRTQRNFPTHNHRHPSRTHNQCFAVFLNQHQVSLWQAERFDSEKPGCQSILTQALWKDNTVSHARKHTQRDYSVHHTKPASPYLSLLQSLSRWEFPFILKTSSIQLRDEPNLRLRHKYDSKQD